VFDQLEDDVEQLQEALFKISSHYAKIQFGLRQVASASSSESDSRLKDLKDLTSQGLDDTEHSLVLSKTTYCAPCEDCCPLESRSMTICEGATYNATLCNIVEQDGGKAQERSFKAVGKIRPVGRNMQHALYDIE